MRRTIHTILYPFILALFVMLFSQAPLHAKTVGVIMTGDIPYYHVLHKAMLEEISSYLDEKNIELVVQTPLPNPMSWTNAGRKLKALGAEVIVTYGLPATLATLKEAGTIPVVFAGVYSPETMNVAGNYSTGVSSTVPYGPVLNDLKSVSGFSNLGIVFNKTEKDSIIQAREVKKLEGQLNFRTVLLNLSGKLDTEKLATCDAVLLTSCSAGMCAPHLPEIVRQARDRKIPTIALIGGAENMVVMTFASSAGEQGRKTAGILRRVLDGESPGNIPVQNPEEIEFTINLKEARAVEIDIPAGVLGSATRVIE